MSYMETELVYLIDILNDIFLSFVLLQLILNPQNRHLTS